jgi:hypothetical protein
MDIKTEVDLAGEEHGPLKGSQVRCLGAIRHDVTLPRRLRRSPFSSALSRAVRVAQLRGMSRKWPSARWRRKATAEIAAAVIDLDPKAPQQLSKRRYCTRKCRILLSLACFAGRA